VFGVQLSDAPREAEANLLDETMHRRLLPGDGDGDVAGFVRLLDEIGAKAPIGVEVISDQLAALAPEEAARRAGSAARTVLARARAAAPQPAGA
jgi:sugar phosphate isomerase/epimerase